MPASAPPEPRGHRVETPLRVLARLASKNPACGGGAAGGGGGLGALNADRVRERLSSPCVLSRKATRGWRIVTHSKAQKYRRLARECLVLARTVSTEEARQLEGDGASLAPFSRRTGPRIRTRVHAAVHRRANATGRPAATAGSAQGRRISGLSSRF